MIRLRELREKRGLSMMDTAKLLDMPYTTYVNYEKGTREPNIETLFELADFFDVTIDELLGHCAPNEPLTLDSRLTPKMVTCPKEWQGVRDTRFYCPGCKKAVKKGESYCHKCGQALIFPAQRYDKENNRIWLDFSDRRPPEGENT